MIMPSYSVLPESMLSPTQITEKFNSPTMSGLRELGEDTTQGQAFLDSFNSSGGTIDMTGEGGGGTPQWASLLVSGGMDIARLLAVQPGTTQTAAGISRQAVGYPISSVGVGTSLTGTGLNSTTLLLIAAVGAAVLFMGSKK